MEALQESSSKLNEDRIFELKQRHEDVLMENDSLNAQGQALRREVSSLRYENPSDTMSYVMGIYGNSKETT